MPHEHQECLDYLKAAIGLRERVESPEHYVRVYHNRIAVRRKDGARMGWEELQRVKQDILGDSIAIEVYPAAGDVVNKRHTRHLWYGPAIEAVVRKVCVHPELTAQIGKAQR